VQGIFITLFLLTRFENDLSSLRSFNILLNVDSHTHIF